MGLSILLGGSRMAGAAMALEPIKAAEIEAKGRLRLGETALRASLVRCRRGVASLVYAHGVHGPSILPESLRGCCCRPDEVAATQFEAGVEYERERKKA
jgi:hypothetical protein